MQKYLNHVKQALQQLRGEIVLPMPTFSADALTAAAKDPDTLETLQDTVVTWSGILAEAMQRESEKQPDGKGPLAEIDFWRARSAVLCGLWEQLNSKASSAIITAMEAGIDDANLMSAFKSQLAELGKLAHEVSHMQGHSAGGRLSHVQGGSSVEQIGMYAHTAAGVLHGSCNVSTASVCLACAGPGQRQVPVNTGAPLPQHQQRSTHRHP